MAELPPRLDQRAAAGRDPSVSTLRDIERNLTFSDIGFLSFDRLKRRENDMESLPFDYFLLS